LSNNPQERRGATPINFDAPIKTPHPTGHVLAARITAENPDEVTANLYLVD
jgi:hypothetical protein